MKQEEFLIKLKMELNDIDREDLKQIEEYYQELIYDGMEQGYTEEQILARFGSPEEVAKRVRAEYGTLAVYAEEQKGQTYQAESMVHTIHVEAENMRIQIRPVENGPVRVLFQPRDGEDQVCFTETNGVFSFVHKMRGLFHWNWLNLFVDFRFIVIEIPRNYAGTLRLKTSNASIKASGLKQLNKGEFFNSNGRISVNNIYADTLLLNTDNAKLDLSGLGGKRLEALTNNGVITARECNFMESISLQTKNGFVTGKNLISDQITLQTCNGAVTGSIIGNINDYNIDSCTVNGTNNLKNCSDPERTKQLVAKTANGRVHVEFVQ